MRGLIGYASLSGICLAALLTIESQPAELLLTRQSFGGTGPSHVEFAEQFVFEQAQCPSVHASSMAVLPERRLVAAWFGGAREGARDVSIYLSVWSPDDNRWSAPRIVATREQTAEQLQRAIAKLGNPVIYCDSRNRWWLFYVTVSFGGWSGSSITVCWSDDAGLTWSPAKRLVTSPFLNVSTLVRNGPLETECGRLVLPVYHEFVNKFSELMVIDGDGRLECKQRISNTPGAIQPVAVPIDDAQLRLFYRSNQASEKFVLTNRVTGLRNMDCSPVTNVNVHNPDAAVSVARWGDGFIMVCNPTTNGRHQLAVATSPDGLDWTIRRYLESGRDGEEYSYPFLVQTGNETYHAIYTWRRERIKHVAFTKDWVEAAQ